MGGAGAAIQKRIDFFEVLMTACTHNSNLITYIEAQFNIDEFERSVI